MMKRGFAVLAFVALVSPAQAENRQVKAAIEGFIRPAYAEFHEKSSHLRQGMEVLCATPSAEKLTAARAAFLGEVESWSQVEIIRFGPAAEQNRLERILYWPDRRSLGLKQIQALLAAKDPGVTDPANLPAKSVAVQGLGALEYVLYGEGSDDLGAKGEAGFRCAYGLAVSKNVEAMAADIEAGWAEADGVAQKWANPGVGNALYQKDSEAVTELFNVFVHGLEMLRDVRLKAILGVSRSEDKPRQAIFHRSGATFASWRGNLLGMQKLFEVSGIASTLPEQSAWISQSISFEFNTGIQLTEKNAGPIAEVLADARRDQLTAIIMISSHLTELFSVNLADALHITAGFSSLDGD